MKSVWTLSCGIVVGLSALLVQPQDDTAESAKQDETQPERVELSFEWPEKQQINTELNLEAQWLESAIGHRGKQDGTDQFWVDLSFSPTQTATLLGVHVREPDETLRSQLKIESGMGLVVEQVVGESAAAAAELKMHDVLLAFDDQLLVNQDQLTTLVRNHEAGDTVTLTLVREGKKTTVDVELQEGDVSNAEAIDATQSGWLLNVHPRLDLSTFHHSEHANMNCSNCHQAAGGSGN